MDYSLWARKESDTTERLSLSDFQSEKREHEGEN